MSDRIAKQAPATERQRVFKSHQVAGMGVTVPARAQITPGDLPSSLSVESDTELQAGGSEAGYLMEAARDAEERAAALERRAAALLKEAEETVRQRLREVEAKIDELLSRTTDAVEQVEVQAREKGYEAGREEGHAEGVQQATTEAERILERARHDADVLRSDAELEAEVMRHDATDERTALLEASRAQVLDLAFAMARQILKIELASKPEAMLPMIEAALSKMKGEVEPQVRVSPAVLALLEEHRGRLLASLPGARRINLESDNAMKPGDFAIQGAGGIVDGRIAEQIKQLEDAVRGER